MKVHISLNVKDIDRSVNFYKRMLAAEPVKLINATGGVEVIGEGDAKRGYAKFDLENPGLNLVLNEVDFSSGGSLSHLGLQVETTEDVLAFRERWKSEELTTVDEMDVACCYAQQDKTWVSDPDGNEWEAFVVLADLVSKEGQASSCGCSNMVSEDVETVANDGSGSSCGIDSTVLEPADHESSMTSCC